MASTPPGAPAPRSAAAAPNSPFTAVPPINTPPFPSPYSTPLQPDPDPTLQSALTAAIPDPSSTVPMCIVALPFNGADYKYATFRPHENHYTASLAKVAAMYAAYELRKTLNDIATELGPSAQPAIVMKRAQDYLNSCVVDKQGPAASALANATLDSRSVHPLTRDNKLTHLSGNFECATGGSGNIVNFTSDFDKHLDRMMSVSDNNSAGACVHASGYGYLNGVLSSAGFFDSTSQTGIWLCGDYSDFKRWGALTVPTVNDGPASAVATVYQLASLFALLHKGLAAGLGSTSEFGPPGPALNDKKSCQDMFTLLASTMTIPKPETSNQPPQEIFVNRGNNLSYRVTRGKLGLGSTKPGLEVDSEAAFLIYRADPNAPILADPNPEIVPGTRAFIVSWQNFTPVVAPDTRLTWRGQVSAYLPITSIVQAALSTYVAATP